MSSVTSTTHYFNRTRYGKIPLTSFNYGAWGDTIFHVLRAVDADNISLAKKNQRQSVLVTGAVGSVPLRSLAPSPCLAPRNPTIPQSLQTPRKLWETLQARLDPAIASQVHRSTSPKGRETNAYFARLHEHYHQLAVTAEAISGEEIRTNTPRHRNNPKQQPEYPCDRQLPRRSKK